MPAAQEALPQPRIVKTVSVRRGGTLMRALVDAGAVRAEAAEAIASLRDVYDPRRLKPGQKISVTFRNPELAGDGPRLLEVTIEASAERAVAAARGEDGSFAAIEIEIELRGVSRHIAGVITDNLFASARRADLPVPVIMALIRLYSWDVDFQRDIQREDSFEVFYERLHDPDGAAVKEGEIAFASLSLSGKEITLYRFEDHHGEADYYHENGASVRKALLRTPVDGARLSSGYGKRKHPVLGYNKMHRGVDFAAPRGTPIMGRRRRRHRGFGPQRRLRQVRAHPPQLRVQDRVRAHEPDRQCGAPRQAGAPGRHRRLCRLDRALDGSASALRGPARRPSDQSHDAEAADRRQARRR